MILGPYYTNNHKRFLSVTQAEWKVVLYKCKKHIRIRLKQKTSAGAHAASTVGSDPVEFYLGLAYTKLLEGAWEWKQQYTLLEQMIRAIDSAITKQVEKYTTKKAEALRITYRDDITDEFYVIDDDHFEPDEEQKFKEQADALHDAARGDTELEIIYEAICEGMKRSDIAELLSKSPKQFDKLKEKLINKVRKSQQS